jgi:hypothetical protein
MLTELRSSGDSGQGHISLSGLIKPPAKGNILKPDSTHDWGEIGSHVSFIGSMGDGLPVGPAVRRLEDPHPGDCRCLLEGIAGDRCSAALSGLGRRGYAGPGDGYPRNAEEHTCR